MDPIRGVKLARRSGKNQIAPGLVIFQLAQHVLPALPGNKKAKLFGGRRLFPRAKAAQLGKQLIAGMAALRHKNPMSS